MKQVLIFLCCIAYALLMVWGVVEMFGGSSYPVERCKEFTWIKGDTTKHAGVKVVSPCSVSDLP